jgi:hypothetical protein
MDFNGLTCRAYVGLEKFKIAKILRRIPGAKRPAKRLLQFLLPSKPVWLQVQSGMSQGMWMRVNLQADTGLWRGEHEPTLQEALPAVVLPGMVVYDIGAHMGSIALGVARLVGPNGHVVAFEADPQNAETLRENRDRNYLTGTLQIVSSAVWSYSSKGDLLSERRREEGTRRSRDGRTTLRSRARTVD